MAVFNPAVFNPAVFNTADAAPPAAPSDPLPGAPTIEETRLAQEATQTRPAPAVCQYGLCQSGHDHPQGHSWLDNVQPRQWEL